MLISFIKEFKSINKLLRSWKYCYDYEFEENPELESTLKTALYIHKFLGIRNKKHLIKKSLDNSWWQYFNRIFPFSIKENPFELQKYLPRSYSQISKFIDQNSHHSLIIQTYLLNGWSVLLLLLISKLSTRNIPLYIVLNKDMSKQIFNYLSTTIKKHKLEESLMKNLHFININDTKSTSLFDAFKSGGIVFNVIDIPLSDKWAGPIHKIQLFKNNLSVGEGILTLAAKYNVPIIPMTAFFNKYSFKIKQYPLQIYTHLGLKPSTISYTLEKLYAPLVDCINKYPEKWLRWQDFKQLKPVFHIDESSIKQTRSKHFAKQTLLWYSHKNTTLIINLQNGQITEVYKKIFDTILNSKDKKTAYLQTSRSYPDIDNNTLTYLLNQLFL